MEPTQEKKSNGALVGAIIVIVLIIIGGLYLVLNRNTETTTPENVNTEESTIIKEETMPSGEDLGASILNSLESLEEEINTTDTEVDVTNIE